MIQYFHLIYMIVFSQDEDGTLFTNEVKEDFALRIFD